MSGFIKYFSVIFMFLLILTYALWVKYYSGIYGSVVFSAEVPENNVILVPALDSGKYRIHLTGDGKKCQLARDKSCVIFNNVVDNKCIVKINYKEIFGQVAICGSGRNNAHMSTMDLMDFDVVSDSDDILIDIPSLVGDVYRPVITLTREPPNSFVRWIHPDYGVRSIFIYMIFLLYGVRYFLVVSFLALVIFLIIKRIK